MSLDDTSSASTLTLLDDYAFKRDLLTMMSDTGPETTDELKRRSKTVLLEMGSTITSVHGVSTTDLLDAMMEGPEKAGLSSGVRYAAAAIIVAYQKGKAPSNSSASELTKLAQDWLLFFLWPCIYITFFVHNLLLMIGQLKKPIDPPTLHNRRSSLPLSMFPKSLLTLCPRRREAPDFGIWYAAASRHLCRMFY
jgi:hypothetical protein